MAFTYLIINLIFLVCVAVLFGQHLQKPGKALWSTLIVLLILTAVFDSIIVGLNIVQYDPSKILGIIVGKAPIEDFFYAILAVGIVPALWNLFGQKHRNTDPLKRSK
jgi:lycopene cyclase domain-containing protein